MLRVGAVIISSIILCAVASGQALTQTPDVDRVVEALLGDTPMIEDLRQLTDEIGGRPTGSVANVKSVEWALEKFREAGVTAHKEAFTMPQLWLERSCLAKVTGDVSFDVRVVSMPFSAATPPEGTTAPLVDAGAGTDEDFTRLGAVAKDVFILIETPPLRDIDGLFREYTENAAIERRAFDAGVAGIVYMSSRANGLLYRHNASLGFDNKHAIVAMDRAEAQRVVRLLRAGRKLDLSVTIDIAGGGPYECYNVIGEIEGSERPDEFVVVGSHLDSWGLGTGANDNGCNVVMMIDIARQMKRLGIRPKRTIRFVLWNGEEQGFYGSRDYTRRHANEMDRHVMACTIDIGSGRILGFFTNGREEMIAPVEDALEPVRSMGPFEHPNVPIVGTDNYDFMMQGVGNLVANQDPYNYGPNYHAQSDTFDKVDSEQLRSNAAIVAAIVCGFAEMDVTWSRQSRAQIQTMIDETNLGAEMRVFGLMPAWEDGTRGKK